MPARRPKRLSDDDDEGSIYDLETTPPSKRNRTATKIRRMDQEPANGSRQTPTKSRGSKPRPSDKKSQQSVASVTVPVPDSSGQSHQKGALSTPKKPKAASTGEPSLLVRNADRSARRKSTRNLLDQKATNEIDSESDPEENLLARQIWEAEGEADSSDQQGSDEDALAEGTASAAATPSKRKAGRRKQKSPTPPQNLPPHEQYFWDNRPGRVKTSDNTLSSLSLLTHEQYHDRIRSYKDPHASSYKFLHTLHTRSFPQWRFELTESFNICLYGYGSKRHLVQDFASYLHRHSPEGKPPKILIANAYSPKFTLSTLLTNLAGLIYDRPVSALPKLPAQPADLLTALLSHLTTTPPPTTPLHIFINSLDAPALRRGTIPALFSTLAAHPHVCFLATCDTPTFPVLWDVSTRDKYNFVFHDATTFISYAGPDPTISPAPAALDSSSANNSTPQDSHTPTGAAAAAAPEIPDPISSLNDLLNRTSRTIKGKEGVTYVLRSLPENARSLYRILVSEILAALDEDTAGAHDDHNDDAPARPTATAPTKSTNTNAAYINIGIDQRTLYRKTVEEFVCSSEMGFRQLLKEFWDHDMLVSLSPNASVGVVGVVGAGGLGGAGGAGGGIGGAGGAGGGIGGGGHGGGEVLGVPWRREECEAILEELV